MLVQTNLCWLSCFAALSKKLKRKEDLKKVSTKLANNVKSMQSANSWSPLLFINFYACAIHIMYTTMENLIIWKICALQTMYVYPLYSIPEWLAKGVLWARYKNILPTYWEDYNPFPFIKSYNLKRPLFHELYCFLLT